MFTEKELRIIKRGLNRLRHEYLTKIDESVNEQDEEMFDRMLGEVLAVRKEINKMIRELKAH